MPGSWHHCLRRRCGTCPSVGLLLVVQGGIGGKEILCILLAWKTIRCFCCERRGIAARWGITLQGSGVETFSVLPSERTSASSLSSKLAWLLPPFYKQIPFSPLIRTQSLGVVCFKIKFCFGVNCQLLCFRGCLPAWKSLPLPRPRGDSQPHPAPFFGVFLFFGVNVGKCENKSVCFSPGNCSAAPSRRTPCFGGC